MQQYKFVMSRERQAYTWSECVLKRTKAASSPPVLSFFKRRTSNQAIFFMACPHQDPDWWKRAQLLLTGDVESNPGPMSYYAICTQNYLISNLHPMQSYHPSLDSPQMLTHQTQILLTLIHMSHTSNPYLKNSSPYTQSNTKNPPHTSTNQTNHPKPINSPFNNIKQHQHNAAQHQLNRQENN